MKRVILKSDASIPPIKYSDKVLSEGEQRAVA
jgi:hypothetical protein